VKLFDADKTRMIGLPYDNMLSRFHLILERHGQTDRQDGRTDRIAISISRVSVLTRDKKAVFYNTLKRINLKQNF